MKKTIITAMAIAGLAFLAGCDTGDKTAKVPVEPKWKGAPYRIAFDAPPAKPNPAGITLSGVKYTANPEALENRARLVVRFDASDLTQKAENGPVMNQMVMGPIDMHGADGGLPADYMERASNDLSKLFGAYCANGKIKMSVALARSSLSSNPSDAELDAKRISDWLPTEVLFKNPKKKC